jgi:methionine-rich copper-binding protein CopC
MRRIVAVAALAIVALAVPPTSVFAHARYDHSTPASEQVVATSPPAVDIYTAQDMRKTTGADVIAVMGLDGKHVDTGNTVVDDSNRRHFSIGLQPNLPPGRYLVSFKTLSDEDGEADQGQFAFYVQTPPTADQKAEDAKLQITTDTGTDSQPTSHTGLYIAIGGAIAAVIVIAAGGFAWARRRGAAAS